MSIAAGNASKTLPETPDHPVGQTVEQTDPRSGPPKADARALQAQVSHAVGRDEADYKNAKAGIADYLRHAQKQSGRGPLELVREFYRLHRGPGKMTLPEYVQYGVYDRSRHSPEDQARFITNTLHWPITRACCDMTWQATTEDKWLCSHILAQSQVRIPETLAVIDTSERTYPNTHKISTAAALRDFMTSQDAVPLFGKENRGICSFGAFLVEEADADGMVLRGQGRLGYETCMEQWIGATPYLLQPLQRNHSFFDRYTDGLATVRVCILLDRDGIRIPFAVLKLPGQGMIADSFWRPGNVACNLDPGSGRIVTARTKDPLGTTDHTLHPQTETPLVGETLPYWDRVLGMAHACAPIFTPVRYQSMDIAITQDGPVLIEINTGGGFDLPQLASGVGFLTDEVRTFFRDSGYAKL
ncbi:sugar-transfer associated ATP-grasp domain-containing protein [Pelagibius sp.]|uniref:sugar-transfer associated ATP-grasp domain-containing protein n=1 Tax=Pelagibius sp. TaxID=1931238 RepID=UPI003B50670D